MLRRLQRGEVLLLPHSRPMSAVGARCHELRVRDHGTNWRVVYRLDADAVVIIAVFQKTTRTTPVRVIRMAQARLRSYDEGEADEFR